MEVKPEWAVDPPQIKQASKELVEQFKLVAEAPFPVVAMAICKDRVFVATTQRVYELIDGILRPMVFAVEPDEK